MVGFQQQGHKYTSLPGEKEINWLGVTTLVGKLHEQFEWTPYQSSIRKPTTAKPNKWYGLPVDEIAAAWEGEKNRSTTLGSWYHDKREQEYKGKDNVVWYTINGDTKIAPDQKLQDGIYPEHLVYLESAGVCGQSDLVRVENSIVYINDYKTCKEIKTKGYKSYEGTKKMLGVVRHLEDCSFSHYALQLSLYMYMILRHNPQLKPGELTIEHVLFEEESRDKYDYPIYRRDEQGGYIVKDIVYLKVPYLAKEVKLIIDKLKEGGYK